MDGRLKRTAVARAQAAGLYTELGRLALRLGEMDRARDYFRRSQTHRIESEQAVAQIRVSRPRSSDGRPK